MKYDSHFFADPNHQFLFGEKYMCPDYYLTGFEHGDCFDAYSGAGPDVLRYSTQNNIFGKDAYSKAYPDTVGFAPSSHWGSAHAAGFNMCFCDGSVHVVSFGITPTIHDQLGNRQDGNAIDVSTIDQ